MEEIINFIKEGIRDHWPFFVMAMILGTAGQVFKTRVWTIERARSSRVFWWIRAFLPFHAPIAGGLIGLVLGAIFGEGAPASPGVTGLGMVMMYYAGAGVVSSWIFNGAKYFAESRGLPIPEELDDKDSLPPPAGGDTYGPDEITKVDPHPSEKNRIV